LLEDRINLKDNTVGRQIKISKVDLAYIAGFLDGDGSIMFQVKKAKNRTNGKRLMFTICLYQDTRHEKPLFWMRKLLGVGYISRRNDGMTELRINGYAQVKKILESLSPYLKFKKIQAKYISAHSKCSCNCKDPNISVGSKKDGKITRGFEEYNGILVCPRNDFLEFSKLWEFRTSHNMLTS